MPSTHQGRRVPSHTPLGAIMLHRGIRAYVLAGQTQISDRTLTEYLAGRRPIRSDHLARLSQYLQVSPQALQTHQHNVVPVLE
jgi:hypothetical protein